MALNTKIRGAQISTDYAGVGLAISNDNLKVDLNEVPAIGDLIASSDNLIFVDASDNATKKYTVGNFISEVAGSGLTSDGVDLNVNVDGSSIEISGDALQVKSGGITNDMLAGSIADGKLAEDYIKTSEVDDSSIEFSSATLSIKAGGVTNAMLAGSIADAKLAEDYIKTSEVDNATIEFSSATLSIKDGGVDTTQLANDAVTEPKIGVTDSPSNGEVLTYVTDHLEWSPCVDEKVKARTGQPAEYLEDAVADLSGAIVDVANDFFLIRDSNDNLKGKVEKVSDFIALIAGSGLSESSGVLSVNVDNSTIDIASDILGIKDGGVDTNQLANDAVTEPKIGATDSPSNGEVLTYVTDHLEWTAKTEIAEDYIQEAEVKFEDESANCNGSTVAFTLGSSPVTNSVQVFLNGLLQQAGSGKDYTLAGTTVTFATAPASGDILLIHYIAT